MRVSGGAVLVAATILVLTGCGSQATQPTRSATVTVAPITSTPTATPTPSAAVTASATPVTSAAPTTTPAATDAGRPANQCTDLGVSVVPDAGGGAAGSEHYRVLIINTGGTTCALRGTPEVSVVGDGNGTQLGKAADRVQTGVKTLQLHAGDTAVAPLTVVHIGTDGGPLDGCTVQKGDGYRVTPPHSTRSFVYEDSTSVACVQGPSFMTVGPLASRTG